LPVSGLSGAASCGRTALVFSVVRFHDKRSAMAWIAVFSFWPSDWLSGACVLRSMIWSSSSRFTSIRRRIVIFG
jgi:hypothetical protein